jgi:hypothetical protein
MIAVFRDKSNIGYLMYLADAVGYLGYVGVMLFRSFWPSPIHYLSFFLRSTLLVCVLSLASMTLCWLYFRRRFAELDVVQRSQDPQNQDESMGAVVGAPEQ